MSEPTTNVLFDEIGDAGRITLNRPKQLNTLTYDMKGRILLKLQEWNGKKSLVLIKGSGDRAFCAGGDLRTIIKLRTKVVEVYEDFNRIVHFMKNMSAPYVALIDGVTMGMGAGFSVHGSHCVATERTVFAMPEARIGLCMDGGVALVLRRLKGKLGLYLALTGSSLTGADVVHVGVATHYVPSEKICDLEEEILRCKGKEEVDAVLERVAVRDLPEFTLSDVVNKMDACFTAESVEEVVANLERDGSPWAKDTLRILSGNCPTTLKIHFRLMQMDGEHEDYLRTEYRIVNRILAAKNPYEGLRAFLIEKDGKPKWTPPTLAEVTDEEIDRYFSELPPEKELVLSKM